MRIKADNLNSFQCPATGFESCCRGDRCAAWRWSRAKETDAYLKDVQAHMVVEDVNFAKAAQAVWAEKGGSYEQTEGYCGMGGRPE